MFAAHCKEYLNADRNSNFLLLIEQEVWVPRYMHTEGKIIKCETSKTAHQMKQQISFKTVHSKAFLSLTQWTVMKVTWWRSYINMNIYKLIQNSCKLLYLLSLAMKSCCFYGAKQLYSISTHSRAPSSICYSVQSMQSNSNWVSKSDKYYGSRICAQIVFFYFQLFFPSSWHWSQSFFFSSPPPTFSTLCLWRKNKNKKQNINMEAFFLFWINTIVFHPQWFIPLDEKLLTCRSTRSSADVWQSRKRWKWNVHKLSVQIIVYKFSTQHYYRQRSTVAHSVSLIEQLTYRITKHTATPPTASPPLHGHWSRLKDCGHGFSFNSFLLLFPFHHL